jgi:UDP-N-acetylglucosamine/UDP-N-acetylgalactosamine diphosphorylase
MMGFEYLWACSGHRCMATNKPDLDELLRPFGQQHLLRFWDRLTPAERERLASEIREIDFERIASLCRQGGGLHDVQALANRVAPPPAFRLGDPQNPIPPEEAKHRGAEALRAGQVAVGLVAGGQGTRLGFDHPKGMFPIGPVSGNSLFQIHVEKVVTASRRYGARIPLYLMTSPATRTETIEFLARRDRFGLPEEDLTVYCQGTMPAVDAASGKILLEEPHRVALSPDGHGGMLAALARHGCLEDMRRRGVRFLFHLQVDNPLVQIGSPEFIGYHSLSQSEMTTQVVAKKTAHDRLGNVVSVDGRLHVIEYSDLPERLAERRAPDGQLLIRAGSIAVHVFDVAFLERMASEPDVLPLHVAHKKVSYIDSGGVRVEPETPNALKFERFIFDLMPRARNAIVVEMDAAGHFAPLKNASGQEEDTPETVRAQMVALHSEWLRRAGAEVPDEVPVEISPLFALDAEELAEKIRPGTRVTGPTYFR